MGSNNQQLEIELTEFGKNLLNLHSAADIINILMLTEQNLSSVPQSPSKSLTTPLNQIINALSAKELVRHPDMNVNISVACCICEILRITAPNDPSNNGQIKEFFELVVMSFEKLASASGRYHGRMNKVLEVFCKARLPVLMLDLKLDGYGLIVRLFKHFLNISSDLLSSNSTAIVLNMENIMSMIIEKNEELAHVLQALVITSLKKDNQSGSPVCWKFGEKVLMICSGKVIPMDGMSIAVYDYPKMVAQICKTTSEMGGKETITYTTKSSKVMKDTTHKIKLILRPCQAASMTSKSVTEMNGKRKRNGEQDRLLDRIEYTDLIKNGCDWFYGFDPRVLYPLRREPFLEHGEILVGRKIKVWRAKDEIYRQGVVKSFDSKDKMHKVLFDDGFEVVDLKWKRWMLLENVSTVPDSHMREAVSKRISSPQSGIICVQGYKVKSINAPILEAIFKKHGDIAAKCVFPDAMRTYLLEAVCEIVGRIETNDVSDVTNIISKMEEIESQVSVAEVAKIDVTWLRAYLDTIHKMNEAQKKSTSLMEMKTNTTLVKMAAKTDMKEGYDEFVAARNRLVKAQRCMKVLELVEKKLNDNLLESKAEKGARQPVI
ncbi:phospholipase-like protein [Artemisia annua]|uniref:Phospholipase-like protein n=1 Tax=Artemisia annua TaxID=35608 RepID=A0A2U1Q8Z3_ARTAN|nr:phospholipase-like protein [Artemisia annua]